MEPTFTDYVLLIYTCFDAFAQDSKRVERFGRPQIYQQKSILVFFMWMQFKQISCFQKQWRWLKQHPEALGVLGWQSIPHRTTLSRRYKALYEVLEELTLYMGHAHANLGHQFNPRGLYQDKSLFKASGSVWHQSDRQANRIPDKLRHLDTDATWSKSAYHGWVYGYGLHLTVTAAGYPVLMQVETASFSEASALQAKETCILEVLHPYFLCGDDSYTAAKRIRTWAKSEVILLTPALRWRGGRYAQAYHAFIREPDMARHLRKRKTAIEPIFDLISKLVGCRGNQKQLAIQSLPNVRTCLALAIFSLQIAMLANSIYSLPFRRISTIQLAFS